jgi:hypothetical protein
MPGFDGTGPRGLGPMTGRGEGYCAIALPSPGTAEAPYGYAGLAGVPVGMGYPYGNPPAYGLSSGGRVEGCVSFAAEAEAVDEALRLAQDGADAGGRDNFRS